MKNYLHNLVLPIENLVTQSMEVLDQGYGYILYESALKFEGNIEKIRLWGIGPQKRLYIPGPLLRIGKNTILIFETEGVHTDTVTLWDEPDLG